MSDRADATFRKPIVKATLARLGLAKHFRRLGLALVFVPLFAWPLVLLVAGAVSSPAFAQMFLATMPFLFLLGAIWIVASFVLRRVPALRSSVAEIEGGVLRLGEGAAARKIPLERIAGGRLLPLERRVELDLHGGDVVRVDVASLQDGAALLEAAGVDASRRAISFQLGETTFLDALSILLGPGLAGIAVSFVERETSITIAYYAFLVAVLSIFYGMRFLFGPAKLTVGVDGLVVERFLRRRFVPLDRVKRVVTGHDAVMIHLDDGEHVRARARHLTAEQGAEIEARVADAAAVATRGAPTATALARLDRGDRTIDAWRAGLRALLAGDEGYRAQALDRDALLAVVESPGATIERRVAAAVAITSGASQDGEARRRVRVAAEASASPRVRVALEKASEGELDDAAIEEAMQDQARAAQRLG